MAGAVIEELTGFQAQSEAHSSVPTRPLNQRWMTPELIERTRRVWSREYGREVSEEEAVEMLTTVRQLADMVLKRRLGSQ